MINSEGNMDHNILVSLGHAQTSLLSLGLLLYSLKSNVSLGSNLEVQVLSHGARTSQLSGLGSISQVLASEWILTRVIISAHSRC